ncbi:MULTISPECIES: transposase [Okeania]|uniref:Probable transposase IS891/IS1136/IS1341 domain-containing protein n=1 Tax=Okeania hirsuta TaxID=1458930 RepID=A0A3N6PCI6_9CYAN|nr:hypothetical protein D4Z78_24340 [Okeania hirsuta]RQH43827.1 hypothetical protein D5R40_12390 [Okeania hirsuta]
MPIIHGQIKDSRLDYTHKLTTQLIRENQRIVVEDLGVKNMVKNYNPPPSPSREGDGGGL